MRAVQHPHVPRRYFIYAFIILAVIAASAVILIREWQETGRRITASDALVAEIAVRLKARQAEAAAKKVEPVYITLPGAARIEALRDDYDDPDSLWAMVNKERSAGADYVPADLIRPDVPIRPNATADEQKVRQVMAGPLKELFAAAQTHGFNLMAGSAYRSAVTQESLFNSYVAASGLEKAQQYSARPGHSEHQLGLAVDISTVSQACYLDECFLGTPEGSWLADNAYKYGFTLRYKKDKEAITGYNFEPWHYRYVGVPLATALYQSDLTLEEAWPLLTKAQDELKANKADI